MNTLKILFVLSILLSPHIRSQGASNDSTLSGIESLHNSGQYLAAELEARRMYEQTGLNDSTRVQIEKWIAFSLIAQGKSAAAKERFVALLRIDGTFELDPVLTSPKILAVFNDARVKYLSQKRNEITDTSHAVVMQRPAISFRTVVFPGWEQIHQGRETAGYLFLGAGTAALASGIVFEVLRANARDEYLNAKITADISSKYDAYNSYRKAEIYSFAAFAAVYLASEIDVFTGSTITVQPAYSMKNGGQLFFAIRF